MPDFNAKRPAKKEAINTVETLYDLANLQDMDVAQLKPIVETKNVYLYVPEIQAIVENKDEGFDAKKFVAFCKSLGIVNPNEPRGIGGGGGSRLTMERAKEVAPGKEKEYIALMTKIEADTRAINILMDASGHVLGLALKVKPSAKKKEEAKTDPDKTPGTEG